MNEPRGKVGVAGALKDNRHRNLAHVSDQDEIQG